MEKQFVGKNICKQIDQTEILTVSKFDLLHQYFAQMSISNGTTYNNLVEAERHFFNWFNANLNKNALPNYIEQRAILPRKIRKQITILIPKTNVILNKIYGQQCENETYVYRCLQLLETHLAMYESPVNVPDLKNKTAV